MSSIAKVMSKRPLAIIMAASLALLLANAAFFMTIARKQAAESEAMADSLVEIKKAFGADSHKARAELDAFRKRLPSGDGLTPIIGEVFSVAKKNGLQIPSGDYAQNAVKETGISRFSMELPLVGRYSQIKRFIYDLEVSRYPISMDDMVITSTNENGLIGLKLRISIYYS